MRTLGTALLFSALTLSGCATTGGFNASAGLLAEGHELYQQGRYPQASAVFKRCLEVEQNPACLHNIGLMIETSKYNDPDPKVREAMWADGKTPRGRAVQYYTLAARYGQPESIEALKRLGKEIPPVDLSAPVVSSGSNVSPEVAQGIIGLAGVVGCMLGGGTNCAPAFGAAFVAPPEQPRRAVESSMQQAPVQGSMHSQGVAGRQQVNQAQSVPQVPTASGACVFNTDCQYPASCVKAPGARSGTCAVEVDAAGNRTYDRTGRGVGCMYNSDCEVGFSCNRDRSTVQQGVCVRN